MHHYSPKAKHSFGRVMEILYGAKTTVFTRLAITQLGPPKVNGFFLDEIWSTVSTLLGAGPGRFWAQSAQ